MFFSELHPEHGQSLIINQNIRLDYIFFHEFGHATTFLNNGNYLQTSNKNFNIFFKAEIDTKNYKNDLHEYVSRHLNEAYADIFSIACLCKKYDFKIMKDVIKQVQENRKYVNRRFTLNDFTQQNYSFLRTANLEQIQEFISKYIEQEFKKVFDHNLSIVYLPEFKNNKNLSNYAQIGQQLIDFNIELLPKTKKEIEKLSNNYPIQLIKTESTDDFNFIDKLKSFRFKKENKSKIFTFLNFVLILQKLC